MLIGFGDFASLATRYPSLSWFGLPDKRRVALAIVGDGFDVELHRKNYYKGSNKLARRLNRKCDIIGLGNAYYRAILEADAAHSNATALQDTLKHLGLTWTA